MRYTIFGESHGPAIGVVLQGVPPGLTVDLEAMAFDLGRRAPGKSPMATARKEADQMRKRHFWPVVASFRERPPALLCAP